MMAKIIPLTQGKQTIVDDEDFDWLNQWKWYYNDRGYAVRHMPSNHKMLLYMHRVIMNTPPDMDTDHINGNGLDNRRANLRVCTTSQNLINHPKQIDNTSGYKGVYKNHHHWQSIIMKDGKSIYLGTFKTKEISARAYDEAAKKYFGEFACLNFPEVIK
jgi:hypothetical protein